MFNNKWHIVARFYIPSKIFKLFMPRKKVILRNGYKGSELERLAILIIDRNEFEKKIVVMLLVITHEY